MRLLRIVGLRLRSLLHRNQVERDLDDELRFHLEQLIEQNLAAGMSPRQSRYAALQEFGNPAVRKEECRDERRTRMVENFFEDVRYSIRGFSRDPLLALAATLTLAVAIGASTTIFSIVNSILIRPLPYPGVERIYWVNEHTGPTHDLSIAADYYSLRDENRVFEDVAAYEPATVTWTGADKPEQLDAAQVSASFFRVMATTPRQGRFLASEEEGPKAPPVVVLSYAFWRTRLGGDPNVVGKTINLDRLPNIVIGVMPQGFDFPRGTQVWRPIPMDERSQRQRLSTVPMRIEYILARRKSQTAPRELDAEMLRLTDQIRGEYPKAFASQGFLKGMDITAIPLQQLLTGDLRPALLVLSGAVGLVVLIACVNLANLLLARASTRQRELAVRLALGSSRGRILRQMLTESLVLALPGGIAGAALAGIVVSALNTTKPNVLVRYPAISMDLSVLSFTFALTLVTSLIFGAAPALSAIRISIQEALKSAAHAHSGGRGPTRLRRLLVVAELGISLVLLIGAGLLARSFLKLAHIELGFRSGQLLTLRTRLARAQYATPASQLQFFDDLAGRIKQIPTIRDVALSANLPLSNGYWGYSAFQVAGRPPLPLAQLPQSNTTEVSRDFFRTMGIPIESGRVFDSQDRVSSPEVVVVNEIFARKIFPGENPIGRAILTGFNGANRRTIVGVVGNIRGVALGTEPAALMYSCTCQGDIIPLMGLVIRTSGDPAMSVHSVEAQVYAMDRNQPVFDVKTMEQRIEESLAPQRFQLILIGTFAAIAIFLAAAGVYGVMSYLVTRRTREIGIRMAMGARRADVLRLVIGESILLVIVAVFAGLGGAWALTRYVKSMLYGVTALDGPTFLITPLVLAAMVLAASMGPARRAARVDPMTALREE